MAMKVLLTLPVHDNLLCVAFFSALSFAVVGGVHQVLLPFSTGKHARIGQRRVTVDQMSNMPHLLNKSSLHLNKVLINLHSPPPWLAILTNHCKRYRFMAFIRLGHRGWSLSIYLERPLSFSSEQQFPFHSVTITTRVWAEWNRHHHLSVCLCPCQESSSIVTLIPITISINATEE